MFEPHIRMMDSAAGAAVGMYTSAADVAAQLMQQGAREGHNFGGELGSIVGGAMGWSLGGMVGAVMGLGHGAVVGSKHFVACRADAHRGAPAHAHDPLGPPPAAPVNTEL